MALIGKKRHATRYAPSCMVVVKVFFIIITTVITVVAPLTASAQGARNIKLNEVMTTNEGSVQDEYGQHLPWIEIVNTSYGTYNIRGMYVTTDRRALDKQLSAPQRISLMSPIPSGDERTSLAAQDRLIFFLNSSAAKGTLHLTALVNRNGETWVALYDGNGIDLLDSVTVPPLAADRSYARTSDGDARWEIKEPVDVTPAATNNITTGETKTAKWKRDDPYGIVVTVLSMGIVFACLALLYVVFRLLGIVIVRRRTRKRPSAVMPVKATPKKQCTKIDPKPDYIDIETYVAVIAMAMKDHAAELHDTESGIITISQHHTHWTPV